VRDAGGKIRRTAVGSGANRKRLLSGFLECGECGGSYHALTGRPEWGCSWHRNRGSCANDVRIPQVQLEAAVLKAVREALDEEIAAHALDVAIMELRKRIEAAEPRALEAELAVLDRKIETALDLALELGDLAAVKDRLRGLRDERGRVAGDLARALVDLPTAEDLMPLVRAKLREIEATIRADVAGGRLALGALLGERRIRVYRDGRIEGALALEPEMKLPASRKPQRPADSVVAGGCNTRVGSLPETWHRLAA
jgi:hypothetical protein